MIYVNLIKNTNNPEMNKIYTSQGFVIADYAGNNKNRESTENPIPEENEVTAKIKFVKEEKIILIEVFFHKGEIQLTGKASPKKVTIKGNEEIIFEGNIFNKDNTIYKNVTLFLKTSKNNNKYFSLRIENEVDANISDADDIMNSLEDIQF